MFDGSKLTCISDLQQISSASSIAVRIHSDGDGTVIVRHGVVGDPADGDIGVVHVVVHQHGAVCFYLEV